MKVGLVQANVGFSDHEHYLPLSVAYLQTYAQAHLKRPEKFEFLLPVYKPESIEPLSEKLSEARIAAYSHYTWDANFNLALARRVKERNPGIINIFGGPHVPKVIERHRQINGIPAFEEIDGRKKPIIDRFPERVEIWHKKYPFIDIACHGEGEETFTRVLAKISGENPLAQWVPGISYLGPESKLVVTPELPRMANPNVIPSPFLTGLFDRLMHANPDQKWIGTYETNRGCPFSCTWCDWGSATASKITQFALDRIFAELEWFGKHKIPFIFCADANFGILDRDLEIAKYIADVRKRTGYPQKFSVQNSKNRQEQCFEVQKVLFEAGLANAVVSALQSVNPDTLKAIKRKNISHKPYLENQQRLAKLGMETMSELIWPQPLETYESYANGICDIIANGQHNRIQINKLSILPNPELGDPEELKKYGIETVECPVANIHGALVKTVDDIVESQELVVATSTCTREDYVRGLTFAWTVGLLHFNKLMQIPIVLMFEHYDVDYRELFDIFAEGTFAKLTAHLPESNRPQFPVLSEIRQLFIDKGRAITKGDYEFCNNPDWINIWWPPEEYALIKLYAEGKLDQFYHEASTAFRLILELRGITDMRPLLDALALNRAMLKLPFQTGDLYIQTSFNVKEFHRGILTGENTPLIEGRYAYKIDRTEKWETLKDWCKKVIWWGNKKGAYLYGAAPIDKVNLSGHY